MTKQNCICQCGNEHELVGDTTIDLAKTNTALVDEIYEVMDKMEDENNIPLLMEAMEFYCSTDDTIYGLAKAITVALENTDMSEREENLETKESLSKLLSILTRNK